MIAMRKSAKLLMAATMLTALGALAASAGDARTEKGLAALRAIIADPNTPVAPVLNTFSFSESQFLVDGLTGNEQRALNRVMYENFLRLPGGIETAIRAKTGRSGTNNRG